LRRRTLFGPFRVQNSTCFRSLRIPFSTHSIPKIRCDSETSSIVFLQDFPKEQMLIRECLQEEMFKCITGPQPLHLKQPAVRRLPLVQQIVQRTCIMQRTVRSIALKELHLLSLTLRGLVCMSHLERSDDRILTPLVASNPPCMSHLNLFKPKIYVAQSGPHLVLLLLHLIQPSCLPLQVGNGIQLPTLPIHLYSTILHQPSPRHLGEMSKSKFLELKQVQYNS
jgi:hypothetical protein